VLVVMLYTKFVPRLTYISRISLAFPLGLGTGIVLRASSPGIPAAGGLHEAPDSGE
jgi:hypothetical protein